MTSSIRNNTSSQANCSYDFIPSAYGQGLSNTVQLPSLTALGAIGIHYFLCTRCQDLSAKVREGADEILR